MVQYRLLERLNTNQEWQPNGVVYLDENQERYFFYRHAQNMPFFGIEDLTQLDDIHFPMEEDSQFRWGDIQEWIEAEPFSPEMVLRRSTAKPQPQGQRDLPYHPDEIPLEIQAWLNDLESLTRQQEIRLKEDFAAFVDHGVSPPQSLVEAFWERWARGYYKDPPFRKDDHNVALLLYARAFGRPVEKYPAQQEYLFRHRELYAPFETNLGAWGARASLSKNVSATIDSPVMHVWVLKKADIPQRIIIVGKGLAAYRDKVFSDALVTAIRVQASERDIFNDGLIIIERKVDADDALDVSLPVLGANAPLVGANTAEAAIRELIRQLRHLEQNTGFVQVREVDVNDVREFQSVLRQLAIKARNDGEPILWAADRALIDSEKEMATVQPVVKLFYERLRAGQRGRASPFELLLSPELLGTRSWERLVKAYYEEIIERIAMDARIRFDYYQRRAKGLREDMDQWDKADEHQRLQRWGPTTTLNQRFDDATGLSIWLQPPEIMATKKYFEENVPILIRGYEEWAVKMRGILESLRTASKRPDSPFRRLITTRFFDAALRGCEPETTPRIQKLYREWATPMGDLLRFEWRKKLRLVKANPDDLFTGHTTFNLYQFIDERPDGVQVITELAMIPLTFLDAKRSVILFDPKRRFMIVNDSSDYPQEAPDASSSNNLEQELLQQVKNNSNAVQLAELLREMISQNPQQVSQKVVNLLRPQIDIQALANDSDQVKKYHQEGLSNASFPHLVDYGEAAMSNRALLTARESLEKARNVLPDLLKRWEETRKSLPEERLENLPPIPEQRELECRIYLLIAVAECLATDHLAKEHLPAIYRASQAGSRSEIRDALAAADNINPQYTQEWIEYLSQWDLAAAYNKLTRHMPSEQDLTTAEQYSAIRAFDVIELMNIAAEFHEVTATLSSVKETRASALIKLGPAIERALLSYAANIVYGQLVWLLEILTGRQVAFGRGMIDYGI